MLHPVFLSSSGVGATGLCRRAVLAYALIVAEGRVGRGSSLRRTSRSSPTIFKPSSSRSRPRTVARGEGGQASLTLAQGGVHRPEVALTWGGVQRYLGRASRLGVAIGALILVVGASSASATNRPSFRPVLEAVGKRVVQRGDHDHLPTALLQPGNQPSTKWACVHVEREARHQSRRSCSPPRRERTHQKAAPSSNISSGESETVVSVQPIALLCEQAGRFLQPSPRTHPDRRWQEPPALALAGRGSARYVSRRLRIQA